MALSAACPSSLADPRAKAAVAATGLEQGPEYQTGRCSSGQLSLLTPTPRLVSGGHLAPSWLLSREHLSKRLQVVESWGGLLCGPSLFLGLKDTFSWAASRPSQGRVPRRSFGTRSGLRSTGAVRKGVGALLWGSKCRTLHVPFGSRPKWCGGSWPVVGRVTLVTPGLLAGCFYGHD